MRTSKGDISGPSPGLRERQFSENGEPCKDEVGKDVDCLGRLGLSLTLVQASEKSHVSD